MPAQAEKEAECRHAPEKETECPDHSPEEQAEEEAECPDSLEAEEEAECPVRKVDDFLPP